ncbi:MAG: hypothetical protein LC808_00215 [Actinobacteria bacterium]|nr:hypothetical protein [Actinomycetota bacterium]
MSGDPNTDRWARLRKSAPSALIEHLRLELTGSRGRLTFDVDVLANRLSLPAAIVREGLAFATAVEVLDRMSTVAIHRPCGTSLSADDIEAGICPVDDHRIEAIDVDTKEVFIRDAPPSRDVPWVLCVHGMNTRGPWQEALTWRVATTYHRSLPVYIYKYGRVELGALVRWRQRQLADQLAATIRTLAGEPQGSRLGPRPDAISHSFGTWMIGHALLRHADLKVGRVVLVASILRPDFPWQELIDRDQVDAVLLHRGGKDIPVRLAAYAIPDSGPSGHRGFDPHVPVADRLEPNFSHSAFFDPDRLPSIFTATWQPFLTAPPGDPELDPLGQGLAAWNPPPWRLRGTLIPVVILALIALVVVGTAAVIIRGMASFF